MSGARKSHSAAGRGSWQPRHKKEPPPGKPGGGKFGTKHSSISTDQQPQISTSRYGIFLMLQNSAHELVMRHQPLARSLAWKAGGNKSTAQMEDLVSVANVGLIKASKAYRPDMGVSFGAYAMRVARNEIIDFLRIGKAPIPTLLLDLPASDQRRAAETADEFSIEESAIQDQAVIIWAKRLSAALAVLKPRDRLIFTARHLREAPETLTALADRFAVSIERIRQLDMQAAAKIQRLLAPPWVGRVDRRSYARRMQREIEALPPARDPVDNVTRHAVTGVFHIGKSGPERREAEQ